MREFKLPDDNLRALGNEALLDLMVRVQDDYALLRTLHPNTSVKVYREGQADYPRILWAGDVRGFIEGILKDVQRALASRDLVEKSWMRSIAEELMGERGE